MSNPPTNIDTAFEVEEAIIGWLETHSVPYLENDDNRADLTRYIAARLDVAHVEAANSGSEG